MHLSYIAENLVVNTLDAQSKSCRILYEPHHSILDNILMSSVEDQFYVVEDAAKLKLYDRLFQIPVRCATMYNYSLFMNFSLEKYINTSYVPFIYHIPSVAFIDKVYEYKKEDRYLINEKTKHITKIFLSEHSYDALGRPNKSFVIDIGIPLVQPEQPYEKTKNIAIMNTSIIAQQIHHIMSSTAGLACDLIEINDIDIVKDYKFCIDISSNYKYNLLYALSAGCIPITLKQNPAFTSYIHHVNTPEEIIAIINTASDTTLNTMNINEYLTINHNYSKFAKSINEIVCNVKREVYIK